MVKTTYVPGYPLWPKGYRSPRVKATRVIGVHPDDYRDLKTRKEPQS